MKSTHKQELPFIIFTRACFQKKLLNVRIGSEPHPPVRLVGHTCSDAGHSKIQSYKVDSSVEALDCYWNSASLAPSVLEPCISLVIEVLDCYVELCFTSS